MNKILLAVFVCIFSIGAFACGGNGKDKEEDKKSETIFRPL